MIWFPAKTGHTSPAHLQDMLNFLHINYPQYWLSPLANLNTVADLGEGPGGSGPPLIFKPNWGPKGQKSVFWRSGPLLDPSLKCSNQGDKSRWHSKLKIWWGFAEGFEWWICSQKSIPGKKKNIVSACYTGYGFLDRTNNQGFTLSCKQLNAFLT